MPTKEAVRTFKVSLATSKRYIKLRKETGNVVPKPRPRIAPRIGCYQHAALRAQLEAYDDTTLEKHCELWEEEQGVKVSVSNLETKGHKHRGAYVPEMKRPETRVGVPRAPALLFAGLRV